MHDLENDGPNYRRPENAYRVGQKSEPQMLYIYLRRILADFQFFFTVTTSRKFASQQSLTIPPHLKHVATLPCEIFMSENLYSVCCMCDGSFVGRKTLQNPDVWLAAAAILNTINKIY